MMSTLAAAVSAFLLVSAQEDLIEVHGNLVFFDEVYIALAHLPYDAMASEENAALAEERIIDFLARAGYELARVEAEVRGDRIHLVIDEGRLARMVFRGRGTFTALQLRLAVVLPHLVFNRPEFEHQLEAVSAELGIQGATWEIRPVEGMEHSGLQIEELPLVPGRPLRFGGTHELFVDLPRTDRLSGLRFDVGFDSFVVKLAGGFRSRGVLLPDDRLDTAASFGIRIFEGVGITDDTKVNFNQAAASVSFYAPSFTNSIRPLVEGGADIIRRKREDLLVQEYWWNRFWGSLHLAYEVVEGIEVSAGGGLEHRNLFRAQQANLPPTGLEVADVQKLLGFISLDGDLVFNPGSLRQDRLHHLRIASRQYFGEPFGAINLRYQNVWPFGWNDVWVKVAGAFRWGNFTLADEEPMAGHYLRGVFGEKIYTSTIGALQLEFRYSLSRDDLKISLFHDLAVFEESERAHNNPVMRVGDSVGVGLHALLLDIFQFDAYLAGGFISDGNSTFGLAISLSKAF
jgi:hypothetical protein